MLVYFQFLFIFMWRVRFWKRSYYFHISSFFVIFILKQVFVFYPAQKWNIYYTDVDSLYVCRKVLQLFILSRNEVGVSIEEILVAVLWRVLALVSHHNQETKKTGRQNFPHKMRIRLKILKY